MQDNLPTIREDFSLEAHAMTPDSVVRQVKLIQDVMKLAMKPSEHYGTIPGCGPKPTLLKPGAEKLCSTFRLSPSYSKERIDHQNGHIEYEITCTLKHIGTGLFIGQGLGSCTTLEGKFRYRKAAASCPMCGKDNTIIKGKKEYGGGWLCYKRKGGCGEKFSDGDERIENQEMGRIEHDNPADYYNVVLKMAKKRALVDAVLTSTAASDIFIQDFDDLPDEVLQEVKRAEPQTSAKRRLFESLLSRGVQNGQMKDFINFMQSVFGVDELSESDMEDILGKLDSNINEWEDAVRQTETS